VSDVKHLVDIFEEIGMFVPGANGPQSIPWSEIESYVNLTGVCLSPSEVRAIRQMSVAYVSHYFSGQDPSSVDPYTAVKSEDNLDDKILGAFRRRAASNKRR